MHSTLKMMGLAFEVHDSICKQKEAPTPKYTERKGGPPLMLEKEFKSIETPTALDIFHYAFCHAGILTGNETYKCYIVINV